MMDAKQQEPEPMNELDTINQLFQQQYELLLDYYATDLYSCVPNPCSNPESECDR